MRWGWDKGGCENVHFRNFAKLLFLCFAKFSSNFAKFRETRNQNLGEIFAISRNTKPELGAYFCYFGRINSLDRTYSYVMYLSVVTFDRQGRVRSYLCSLSQTPTYPSLSSTRMKW